MGRFAKTISIAVVCSSLLFSSHSFAGSSWEYSERYSDRDGIVSAFEVRPIGGERVSRVDLTVRGRPGSKVSVSVRPYGKTVSLSETSPGVFEGSYVIGRGERFEASSFVAGVRNGASKSEASIENPVLVRQAEYGDRVVDVKNQQVTVADPFGTASSDRDRDYRDAQCPNCGKVLAIVEVSSVRQRQEEPSVAGMVIGGLAGGLLGNQVGKGTGRDIATLAGIAGGAYVGNEVGKKSGLPARPAWNVDVRFPDGSVRTFTLESPPQFPVGASVRAEGSTLVPR